MPFDNSSLSHPFLAHLFGTLTLRAGGTAALALGAGISVERPESPGEGTPLDAEQIRSALRWDFPEETASSFLLSLKAGSLNGFRYDLSQEGLRTPRDFYPFPREELLRGQDPVDPSLKRAVSKRGGTDIPLTVSGVFLDNIARIPAIAFAEAAYRALGCRQAEIMDLLWMHAGDGELRRHDVTAPILVSLQPPPGVSVATYREFPARFPLVCLQFERARWKIQSRHVIGHPETKERLIALLGKTDWDVQIDGGGGDRRKTVRDALVSLIRRSEPPPPPPESEPPPAPKRPRAVADIFFHPHAELLRKGSPGVIAITKAEIPVEALSRVPREYFDKAVRLCLGVRAPREGDRIVMTAGELFSKKGKIRDCVFVAPEVPDSRTASTYPKIWLVYRSGRWTVLPRSGRGNGHENLLRAVTSVADWGLVLPPTPEPE